MVEHEMGNLNRQEAVSMIPALFLDVQPHHCVYHMHELCYVKIFAFYIISRFVGVALWSNA